MIVKTFRHKRDYFQQLVPYILDDKGRYRPENFDTIFHNLHSIEPDRIIQEFKANDHYRKLRKQGVVAYHEILSFSPESTPHLNKTILRDIAQQYIELRGANALCLAQAHIDTDHVHLHFLFSGVEYRSDKTLRLDNQRFKAVRTGIEQFQETNYPNLNASLVYDRWNKAKDPALAKSKPSTKHENVKATPPIVSDRAQLEELLKDMQADQLTLSAFEQRVADHPDLSVYTYRGKPTGVLYKGKKYRFRSLALQFQPEKNRSFFNLER